MIGFTLHSHFFNKYAAYNHVIFRSRDFWHYYYACTSCKWKHTKTGGSATGSSVFQSAHERRSSVLVGSFAVFQPLDSERSLILLSFCFLGASLSLSYWNKTNFDDLTCYVNVCVKKIVKTSFKKTVQPPNSILETWKYLRLLWERHYRLHKYYILYKELYCYIKKRIKLIHRRMGLLPHSVDFGYRRGNIFFSDWKHLHVPITNHHWPILTGSSANWNLARHSSVYVCMATRSPFIPMGTSLISNVRNLPQTQCLNVSRFWEDHMHGVPVR